LKVKIGDNIIPDAEVKRFIDLQSGLALSMIKISYEGERIRGLDWGEEDKPIPFECDIIKTSVLIQSRSFSLEPNKVEYVLQERYIDVPCGYKLVNTNHENERAIIVPEIIGNIYDNLDNFRKLPFIRFILEEDIPSILKELKS